MKPEHMALILTGFQSDYFSPGGSSFVQGMHVPLAEDTPDMAGLTQRLSAKLGATVTLGAAARDLAVEAAAGCDDYLAQPVNRTALRDLLARHVARARGAGPRRAGGSET